MSTSQTHLHYQQRLYDSVPGFPLQKGLSSYRDHKTSSVYQLWHHPSTIHRSLRIDRQSFIVTCAAIFTPSQIREAITHISSSPLTTPLNDSLPSAFFNVLSSPALRRKLSAVVRSVTSGTSAARAAGAST